MFRNPLASLILLLLLICFLHTPLALAQTPECTVHWNVDSDGFWDEGAHWSGGNPPTLEDVVCIDRPSGDYTITIRQNAGTMTSVHSTETLRLSSDASALRIQAPSETASLLLEAGLLNVQGPGNWLVSGESTYSGGILNVDILNTGTLIFSGASELTPRRSTITNQGTIIHASGAFNDSSGAGGSTIVNEAGALYDLQSDVQFIGGGHFVNRGTLRKSDGEGNAIFLDNWYLDNEGGAVEVQSGQLTWGRGASTGGDFRVDSGATLDLNGGRTSGFPTFSGAYQGGGGGRVSISSGFITFTDATLDFEEGMLHWMGGRITNSTPLANIGHLTLSGSGPFTLQGTLNNSGLIVQQGGALWESQPTGAADRINNLSGGIVRFEGALDVTVEMSNEGTVEKVGPGAVRIAHFNNLSGRLDVQGGVLNLAGRGASTGGTFNVAGGALLETSRDLLSGIHDFAGAYTGGGAGSFVHRGYIRGDSSNPAVLDFPDGFFEWQSGTMVGVIVNDGTLALAGDDPKISRGQWINNGDFMHTGSGAFQLAADSSFTNNGLYDFQSDADLEIQNSATVGTMLFTNHGTLRKSSGAGLTEFSDPGNRGILRLDNQGLVQVQSGELRFREEVAQVNSEALTAGEWRLEDATLALDAYGDLPVNEATIILRGRNSSFTNLAGLTTSTGSLSLFGGARFSTSGGFSNSGELTIGLAGRPASEMFGQIAVAGQAALGGNLHIVLENGFVPNGSDSYPIITHAGHSGTFASATGLEPYFDLAYLVDGVVLTGAGSSADLVAQSTSITVPPLAEPGQEVMISYRVRNASDLALNGTWVDSVYLSTDAHYDPSDILLGRVTHTGGAAAQSDYQESLTATIPGLSEGAYHAILVADSRHFVSDSNYANNYASSPTTIQLLFPELQLGVSENGVLSEGNNAYYRLQLSAGQDVLVTAEFDTEWQGELYLGYGEAPDRNHFGWAAGNDGAPRQQILLTSPFGGTYYLLLHGLPAAATGRPFMLTAQTLPFTLLDASPRQGGNAGNVTVSLQGAGFSTETQVTLRNGNTVVVSADETFVSKNALLAVFDLNGVAPGVYDIHVLDGAEHDTLIAAFTVSEGTGGQFEADLVLPAAVRSALPFRGTVYFENSGDTDVPVELLRVVAPPGGAVWPANLTFADAAPSLQFLSIPAGAASGGVLAPGQAGRFEFWAIIPASGDTTFALNVATSPPGESVDYDEIRSAIQPDDPPQLWAPAYDAAAAGMGTTYGDYLDALVAAVDEARGFGVDIQSLREIWDYLIDRAMMGLPGADVLGAVMVLENGLARPLARETIAFQTSGTSDGGEGRLSRTWYDGSFAIRDLPVGTFDIVVNGHYLPSPGTFTHSGAPAVGLALTVLKGAGAVEGYIVDEDGIGVRNVDITVHGANGLTSAPRVIAQTESDWLGYYRIDGLPENTSLTIMARPGTHVSPAPQVATVHGVTTVNFQVSGGGSLAGAVRAPGGAALAGATVRAGDEIESRTAVTDSAGNYRIDGLAQGDYTVSAWHAGYAPVQLGGVGVDSGATTSGINLTLEEGGDINVWVTGAENGLPVASASVTPLVPGAVTVMSGADGGAFLPDMPPGQVTVRVRHDAYHIYTATVPVVNSATTTLNAPLPPAGDISGSVPGAGIPVTLIGEDTAFPTTVYSDGSGQFSFDGAAEGDYYLALGANPLAGVARQDVSLSSGGDSAVVNFNPTFGELNGRVLAGGATAVSGAFVELIRDGQQVATTISRDGGTFRFIILEPGTYELIATHERIGIQRRTGIAVAAGATLTSQDIVATASSLTVHVSGSVGSLSGAIVTVAPDGVSAQATVIALTDGGGMATFPHLAHGSYSVSVTLPGFATSQQVVSHNGDGTQVSTSLESAHIVSGAVSTASGEPVSAALLLFVRQSDGARFTAVTGIDGLYLANSLPAGIYDVWVTAPANDLQPQMIAGVNLSGNAPVEMDAVLNAAGATLTGQISQGGTPVNLARISVVHEGTVLLSTTSNYDGSYQMQRLPAGVYTLRVQHPGFHSLDVPIIFPASGAMVQNLALGAPLAIAALPASSPASAPLLLENTGGGANLSSWLTNGMPPPSMSGVHENFVMPPLPPDASTELAQAYSDLLLAKVAADRQFHEWQNSYENMGNLNLNNVGLITAQSTALTGKVAALGVALNAASGGTATLAGAGAIGAGYSVGGLISNLTNALMGGDFDGASATLDALDLVLAEAATTLGEKGGAQAVAGLGLYKDARELMDSIRGVAGDAAALQSTTAQSEDLYGQVSDRLLNARQRYFDLLRNADEEDDGAAPEEPPAEDEEEPVDDETPDRMASQDPNDITGPAGYGQRHWLQPIPTFAYTIQFENIATATAPAQEVVITQSLDPDLDWTTFELGDLGFDTWTIAVPAGRKSFAVRFKADEALGLFVDIEATFNQHTGVATWRFVAIDPATGDLVSDPSKGFLPPNILPPEGQGFVTYRIRPLPDLPTGRVVQAQASIVFDANAPIVTPRYVNTIDRTPPQAIINELPVSSPLNFTVSWTGSDGNGSGVALYDVYVAQDGGAYSLWQEATPATQAAFTGRSGVTYDFYAIATDHVGLQQPPPESAQASTSIGYRLLLPLITEN